MLGPIGGNRCWNHADIEAAGAEAQKMADAQEKGADEGGFWYGYSTLQECEYLCEEIAWLDKFQIDKYSDDHLVTGMYVAYKK